MAREFLDFNPWTGIATYTEQHHRDAEITVHQETDVQPLVDAMQRVRRDGVADKGIGTTIRGHYCNLDNVTIMKLKAKGIDVFAKMPNGSPEQRRFMQEIETNYPYLKATEKKGWRPQGTETVSGNGVVVSRAK